MQMFPICRLPSWLIGSLYKCYFLALLIIFFVCDFCHNPFIYRIYHCIDSREYSVLFVKSVWRLLFKAESKACEEDIPGGDKGNCIETTEQEVSLLRSGKERYEKQNRTVVNPRVMASCYFMECHGKANGRRIVMSSTCTVSIYRQIEWPMCWRWVLNRKMGEERGEMPC